MKKWLVLLLLLTCLLVGCENVGSIESTDVSNEVETLDVESDVEDDVKAPVVNRIELLQKIRILPERLNVREDYSVDSDVLTKVHKGAVYDIYQTQLIDNKVWYKICYDKDKFGWIAGWYATELGKIFETDGNDFDDLVVKLNEIKSPYRLPDNKSKIETVLGVGEMFEVYDNVIDEEGVIWYKINRNHIMNWIKAENTEVFLSNKDYHIADDSLVVFEDSELESIIRDTFDIDYDFIRYRDVKDIESLVLNGNFTSLSGLEYFTSLRSFECNTESIKLFDLIKLNDLESLKLRNTVIEDFELIGHFSRLKRLDLIGSDIETIYPVRNLKRLSEISVDEKYMEGLNNLMLTQNFTTTVNIDVPEITIEFDSDVEVANYTVTDPDQETAVITSVTSFELSNSNLNDSVTITLNEGVRPLVVTSADFNGDFYAGWTNSSYDENIRQLVWGFGLMTDNYYGEIIDSPMVEKKTISADKSVWTFKIKDGIKFHNGEPLDVSDIKFTYEFYMDKNALSQTGGSSRISDYIESIDIDENQNTISFKLKNVNYTTDASVFYETWILPEDTITNGANSTNQTYQEYVKSNVSSPIGYGPYIFDEYKESQYVRLKVNPDYIGKTPAIEEIIVKVTRYENEIDQLFNGDIDLMGRTVDADLIRKAKTNNDLKINNYFRHGGGTMILHTDYEAFVLKEVRQAFAFAFNRPKVVDLFLNSYGISPQAPYSKNQWMMYDEDEMDLLGTETNGRFEESLTEYDILDANGNFDETANILKAQELLDVAVARTDGDYKYLTGDKTTGYLWKGELLDIKIVYTAFWTDTYHEVFNDDYISKLGFNVSLLGLDWPVMYGHWTGNTSEDRKYHAYVGGMGYSIKSNPRSTYSTDQIKSWGQPSDNGSRFSGGSSYTPDEWDQLLLDIENCHPVTGNDKYKRLWREYIKACNEEVPVLPVYSNNYHDIYNADLENFETHALWSWPRAVLDANWK
ncbi:MAG: hypothetical protein JEZ08_01680 [Clostridiales bacterium]|nr:hypothetical protein [Clostridiales bacterium]